MTRFDEIAAAAASNAHASSAQVDAHASFPTFQRAVERRRRGRVLASVAAAALAVGAILWAVQVPDARRAEPVDPVPSPRTALGSLHAGSANLTVPVGYTACPCLSRLASTAGDVARFVREDDGGITIFENAIPVRDRAGHRDPTAGTDAQSMARWLANRPFLVDTHIVPVTVGGRPGWRVESRVVGKLDGRSTTTRIIPMGRVLRTANGFAQYGPGSHGDMTFVDVPGAGVTAIWSWNSDAPAPDPARRAWVTGLHFGD
ncbi:hypothetical protein GCM10009798_40830 [Nocardioides panacihumi]|uniref:Uncharacterized protein n=1 Tax=Nocardioides panacihumi TaxID=400774 RepID=A0ABN2RV06_9ACTN